MSDWVYGHASADDVAKLRKTHLASIRARLQLQERVVRLEDELAWVSVIASALAGICIEKGLVTPDELKERIAKLDAADAKGAPGAAPTSVAQRKTGARRRRS